MKKNKTEKHIFKYCSFEVASLIIKNKEIKLNTPNNFNDPYDTRLLLEEKDLKKAMDLVINYILEEQVKTIIFSKNVKIKWWQKPLLFVAKLTFGLQDVSNKRFKEYRPIRNFARMIRVFNSLGLKNGAVVSESQKSLDNFIEILSNSEMTSIMRSNIMESTRNLLITSFSKNPDCILMWSHYADNSRGVCLEFENEDFLEVVYSRKRKKFNINKLLYSVLWNYRNGLDEFETSLETTSLITTISPYLIKSHDWSYEREVRGVFSSKNPNVIKNNKDFFYKMNKLISITFGYRVNEDNLPDIIMFARENNIKLYKMELSNKTFDLIRKEFRID